MFTLKILILDIIFGAIGGIFGALLILKIIKGKK